MLFIHTANVMNGLTTFQEVAVSSAKKLEEKIAAKAEKKETKTKKSK